MPPEDFSTTPRERDEHVLGAALRALPLAAPETSEWPRLQASLAARRRARWQRHVFVGVAMAAAIALAVTVALMPRDRIATGNDAIAGNPTASDAATTAADDRTEATLQDLIALNQAWEGALRRAETAPDTLDGRAALASARLEDMIGMIDVELGQGDGSQDQALWTQRLQLMEELASLRNGSRAILATTDGAARLVPAEYAID